MVELNWKQHIQMSGSRTYRCQYFFLERNENWRTPHYTPYPKPPDVYLFHLMMSLMLLVLVTVFFLLMAYMVHQLKEKKSRNSTKRISRKVALGIREKIYCAK